MEEQRNNGLSKTTIILVIAICMLVVVLAAAIGIALVLKQPDPTEPSGNQTTAATLTPTVPGTSSVPTDPLPPPTTAPIKLVVNSPVENGAVLMENSVVFTGTSDPASPLKVNGTDVTRNADGSFTYTAQLTVGENKIVFSHKGEDVTYTLQHRYVVEKFLPEADTSYNSGATVWFLVSAKEGSTVKVSFNNTTVTMKKSPNQAGTGVAAGYVIYEGSYALTDTNTEDLDLGKATYTATWQGQTETYQSGTITCKKSEEVLSSDPSVTPSGGKYINVGSGYIAEVINYSAETFNGTTRDDYSNPTWNYLPKGTMDYCSPNVVKDTSGKISYRLLRSGQRIYVQKTNTPSSQKVKVVDCYKGKLPDHNELAFSTFSQDGRYTVMTLTTMWKAPFYFDLKPQTYNDPAHRDFTVSACTAQYVEITFCYATVFNGTLTIPADNPLFSSAELISGTSDTTLRLYLKKTGTFYGWDAYYDDAGQLCFQFLNPAKATAATNAFGVDLTGVRIMIDVGHGGIDGGAVGKNSAGQKAEEADRNLALALELKKQLESIGATVVLNRETDKQLTVDERILLLEEYGPDLCIAVHHNSIAGYPNINGFESYYFNVFSKRAAELIYQETAQTDVYKKNGVKWHYYFTCRQSVCPVVLTENGYMSNTYDVDNMLNPESVTKKAQAITRGVAKYFLEINS